MEGYSYHEETFCLDCLRRHKQNEMVVLEGRKQLLRKDLNFLEKESAELKSPAIEAAFKILKETIEDISEIYSSLDLRVDESMADPEITGVCRDCGKQLGE